MTIYDATAVTYDDADYDYSVSAARLVTLGLITSARSTAILA